MESRRTEASDQVLTTWVLSSGTDDLGFKLWADRGISKSLDLYENDNLFKFEYIIDSEHVSSIFR